MPPKSTLGSPLNDIPDELWQIARAREQLVRALVLAPPARGARGEAMEAAANELGITKKHLYHLCRQYEADPRTRSLVPKSGGRPAGLRYLDPRVEEIIEDEITTRFLALLKPKKAPLFRGIRARCAEEGLRLPSRDAIELRLGLISKREQVKRRQGRKAARDKYDPIRGSLEADYPLHIVQMDHTPADIHAVEEETRELIGRPTITLSIDVRTRMYCGFYLTFDPPGAASVAACVAHSVMDKSDWLTARGLPPKWPVMGLFDVLHVDNGKEFHSKALYRACEDYGIEVRHRLPRTPHLGGHVERRIGHLSQEIHLLPGTTFSNVKERGIYDAEGNACLTLSEIEYLVASIILEHHASLHSALQTSPGAKWEAETAGRVIRMPDDMKTFYRDFLPFAERKVNRDGIHLFGIRYWSDVLTPFLHNEERVIVHYNPANLSKVFVRGLSGCYIEVPYRNLRRPAISLWELRAVNRALRRAGRSGVDEGMIFEMILARRKMVEEASGKSRRARLERARGARPSSDPEMISNSRSKVIEGEFTVVHAGDEDDDTPLELPYVETEDWN